MFESKSPNKASAVPLVLTEVPTSYTVEEVTFESKLVIIERPYDHLKSIDLLLPRNNNQVTKGAVNAVVSKSSRVLFSMDRDVSAESKLENIHGYGAFSISELECLTYRTVNNATTQQLCFSIKTALNCYNTLVASPILSLLPRWVTDKNVSQRFFDSPVQRVLRESHTVNEAVDQLISHERSLGHFDSNLCDLHSAQPRVLILGLAAGERLKSLTTELARRSGWSANELYKLGLQLKA
eukprot:gene42302-52452_t